MKKRGFTLIELLAVILILGIVALIAIPLVSSIIKESKKSAFQSTVSNLVTEVENVCEIQNLKNEAITTNYKIVYGVVSPKLDINGKLPVSGKIDVDQNCQLAMTLTNDYYTASKISTSSTVTIVEGNTLGGIHPLYANGTAVYFNPVTGTKCDAASSVSTTGTKTGCMKWYAFTDSTSSSTVNLILDHNTTASVVWNYTGSNISGPAEVTNRLKADTSSWVGVPERTDKYSLNNGIANYTIDYSTYRARLISVKEISRIIGYTWFDELTGLTQFSFETKTSTPPNPYLGTYAWLYNYTNGCTSYGCNVADASTMGYWTGSALAGSTNKVWIVYRTGSMYRDIGTTYTSAGVRPVITISKLSLQ